MGNLLSAIYFLLLQFVSSGLMGVCAYNREWGWLIILCLVSGLSAFMSGICAGKAEDWIESLFHAQGS